VLYSSLNYKDALSASGNKGVTRTYPHTPGVDAAGVVADSCDPRFQIGESVLVTGYDLGMNTAGGWAEYIRVPADWVVKCPTSLTMRQTMIYGTAGFTAALSVFKLQYAGLTPQQGEVLVTGATGGVGSIGVAILAKLGYTVVAVTGKSDSHAFLKQLGAQTILSREEVQDHSSRPLLKARWAGVLDTVGGKTLATALRSTQQRGQVSCCGLVDSWELHTNVFPFILRGINLLGVDSAESPMERRLAMWQLLSTEWNVINQLEELAIECDLATLNAVYIDQILQGQVRGRVVIKISEST
jgi:putative YhdH/YhfP family quinone oxidoreductase